MIRNRAILLEGHAREGKILKRAFKFDWSMLQSIEVDEVTFIEVCVPGDLLPVDLVKHSYILCQINLVVDTVKAFAWSKLAKTFYLNFDLVKNTLICHERMARKFKRTFDLILNTCKAPQARL